MDIETKTGRYPLAEPRRPRPEDEFIPVGTRIGRYYALELLGRGAMGVVYAAYDPELDRQVALKLLNYDRDDERCNRLLREGRALARLKHPNVVTIYDVGKWKDDLFLSMEFVRGKDLKTWLTEPQHDWATVSAVFLAAGQGIAAAHSAGIIHRDFKPSNVLVADDGAIKVLDFGLATVGCAPPSAGRQVSLTDGVHSHSYSVGGTPAYMAPELYAGGHADSRSDQYAFCVALFEALCGERPRRSRDIDEHFREASSEGGGIPRAVRRVVVRGLAEDPDGRFESMTALLAQLERASVDPRRRRRPWLLGVSLVGALMAAIGGEQHLKAAQDSAALEECRSRELDVAGLVSGPRREATRQGLKAAGVSDSYIRIAEEALVDFARRWVTLHSTSCEAWLTHGTLTSEWMARRERCAAEQYLAVDTLVDRLSEADQPVAELLLDLVSQIPRPERCDILRVLAEFDPEGSLPSPVYTAFSGQLASVIVEANGGHLLEARAHVEALLRSARAMNARHLVASSLAAYGGIAQDLGEFDLAEELYLQSLRDAIASDYLFLAAECATRLMYLYGILRAESIEGQRWRWVAEGLVARAEIPELRLLFLNSLGALLGQAGEYSDGLTAYDEALGLTDTLRITDFDRASLLNNRGILLNFLGRHEEALAAHREALRLMRRLVGDEDLLVSAGLNGVGQVYVYTGDLEAARPYFGESLAIQERLLGAENPGLVLPLLNLGNVELEAGRSSSAKIHAERALQLAERNLPPGHPYTGYALVLAGQVAGRRLDEPEKVESLCARGLQTLEAALGAEHPHLTYALVCLADKAITLGDAEVARGLLERALALEGDSPELTNADRGNSRIALAQALFVLGDLEAASSLASEAASYFLAAGPSYQDRAREVQDWVAELTMAGASSRVVNG